MKEEEEKKNYEQWQFFKFLLSLKEGVKKNSLFARRVTLYQTSVRNESHSNKLHKKSAKLSIWS